MKINNIQFCVHSHFSCCVATDAENLQEKQPDNMSNIMRKSVFGVCNQVRLKLVCPATETS